MEILGPGEINEGSVGAERRKHFPAWRLLANAVSGLMNVVADIKAKIISLPSVGLKIVHHSNSSGTSQTCASVYICECARPWPQCTSLAERGGVQRGCVTRQLNKDL